MHECPVKIMLADEAQTDYFLLRDLLAQHQTSPLEITLLPRDEASLTRLLQGDYELCFLSCEADTLRGLEWLWEAQARGNRTPVIALTESDDHELNMVLLEAGASDYLVKSHLTASLLDCAIRAARRTAQTQEALRVSEERYELTAHGANDGLWDWDLPNNEANFSPRWKAMLGYADEEIGNSPEDWFSRVHPEDYASLERALAAHLDGQTPHFEHEHRMLHQDGSYSWMLSRGVAVRDAGGKGRRVVGSQTDITLRRQAEEKLRYGALHDELTGLANRTSFMTRLRRSLERARFDDQYVFAVLMLDLDRFKLINDSLGHRVGDQLLMEIARRLVTALRPSDMVARLGGDEFVVLIDHLREEHDVAYVAERIQKILSVPILLDEREVFTTVSIGITMSSSLSDGAEDLLREADTAMHRAKLNGKARFEIFDPQMREQALRLMQLETDLRRALSREEFMLYYQPIISFESGRLAGFEALIRWNHPQKGFVGPAEFIPISEDNGMINPIGRWVLQEACRQMREWQRKFVGSLPLTMSVNLSGKQFSQPNLIEMIAGILKETELPAPFLKLEITETVLMENSALAAEMLSELKALGSQLAIDDFGTGYSSFSHLHCFPIDTLKIDRAFVSRMDISLESAEIVRTILTLAHNLKMSVVAEGVETSAQIKQLRNLGCEYGQGYFIHRPMPAAEAGKLIAEEMEAQLGKAA
jgi:diguanylate cyclase (GGDEF)-like protein/PAS domain S-box-containing protein